MTLDNFIKSIIESTTKENVERCRTVVYDTALAHWGEKVADYAVKKYDKALKKRFLSVDETN
jgi:hypothetical protein